jgi:hypothetical protein
MGRDDEVFFALRDIFCDFNMVVCDDAFDPFGKVIVDGEKSYEVVAFGTATTGEAFFNGAEAQDTDILRVFQETVSEE